MENKATLMKMMESFTYVQEGNMQGKIKGD
jgi:hypothetical protein